MISTFHISKISAWLLLYLSILITCNLACKSTNKDVQSQSTQTQEKSNLELPQDFVSFYERFHSDTNFQYQHIHFPLAGLPQNADEEYVKDGFYWTRDQWTPHTSLTDTERFVKLYELIGPTLIVEMITDKTNNLSVVRRFAKSGETWSLIYYADMNAYK